MSTLTPREPYGNTFCAPCRGATTSANLTTSEHLTTSEPHVSRVADEACVIADVPRCGVDVERRDTSSPGPLLAAQVRYADEDTSVTAAHPVGGRAVDRRGEQIPRGATSGVPRAGIVGGLVRGAVAVDQTSGAEVADGRHADSVGVGGHQLPAAGQVGGSSPTDRSRRSPRPSSPCASTRSSRGPRRRRRRR